MRFFLPLLVLLTLSSLAAQTGASTLHLDRPYHASGEVAWFSLYLPAPAPATVRVGVFGPDGRERDYFFLRAEAGTVSGHYRWGYDLPTGYYRLGFTTLTADGGVADLGQYRHAVYSVADRSAEAAAARRGGADEATGDLGLELTGGQIVVADAPAGAYSVAVYNASVCGDDPTLASEAVTGAQGYVDTLFYGGVLTEAEGGAPVRVGLLPVFDNTTFATYFSKSDAEGRYLLELPDFRGEREVQVISITDQQPRPRMNAAELPALDESPPLTEEVLAYLDLSNRRRKIYQLYQTVETPLEALPPPVERRDLTASKAYDVQNYKAFPDLYTFFREVAGELRYRDRRDGYEARLYNAPSQRFFTETPLFIVDGRLTRDANYVAKLSPATVERVAFYYGNRNLRELFPALGSQGVVQIDRIRPVTDLPADDAANLLTLQGLQTAQPFPAPADGRPRLSPLLLWQTGTTGGGRMVIDLPPTDDAGNYRVVVTHRDAAGRVRRGLLGVTLATSR
ncbi:hypothetical protein [Lewinella sp. IMCC34183]|uniref:hypothetical protein n=1 Tax=Lewinella sp. IMCC34183 TaxID=2248762 RepID=UPI000E284FC1|nr:hypothetical protein [Lewinella sp. IMCC34183]